MEIETLVNLLVEKGTTIGVIAYFIYRDYKFNVRLENILTTLVDTVNAVKDLIKMDKRDE